MLFLQPVFPLLLKLVLVVLSLAVHPVVGPGWQPVSEPRQKIPAASRHSSLATFEATFHFSFRAVLAIESEKDVLL